MIRRSVCYPVIVIVEVWTDGSGRAAGVNGQPPGPGGWAYVLRAITPDGEVAAEREGSGGIPDVTCTNQRAELTAVAQGLQALRVPSHVTVFTDSEYVIGGFVAAPDYPDAWVAIWQRRDWITRNGTPVLHQDLWQAIQAQVERHHSVTWTHVKGHSRTYACGRCPWTGTQPKRSQERPRSRKVWCPDCDTPLLQPPVATYPLNERCDELAGAQRRNLLDTQPAAAVPA